MRHHDHDHDHSETETEAAAHPTVDRLDPFAMKAVTAGRPEVLGRAGMLGLQRAAGNSAAAGAVEERSPVHDVVSGGGAPLDDGVRDGHGGADGPGLQRGAGAHRRQPRTPRRAR